MKNRAPSLNRLIAGPGVCVQRAIKQSHREKDADHICYRQNRNQNKEKEGKRKKDNFQKQKSDIKRREAKGIYHDGW